MTTQATAPITLSLLDHKGSVVKTWPLTDKKTYRIGRGQGNDIIVESTWVSRQHAMVQIEENGTVYALDMGSANGTMVNGQRIVTPTPLRSGDLVQLGGKSTLTFLQNYTVPLAAPDDPEEMEQTIAVVTRTQVTVLICDIRRFTALSEQIGDQKVSAIIRLWCQKTNEMVAQHQGRIDKFIGDAAMAIWAKGSNLQQSVHLALTCAARIAAMTRELGDRTPGLPWPLAIGAALNTGEAISGNIGVDGNRDYTVIGDTINVAFRLEGLTSTLGKDLLIGSDTAAQLDQRCLAAFFSPCTYQVKGKSTPVLAYGCTFDQLQKYLANQKVVR